MPEFCFKETQHNPVDGSEILHQLRLVVYPIIYMVLYIPGGAGFCPWITFNRLTPIFPVGMT